MNKANDKIHSFEAALAKLNAALTENLENELLRAGLIHYFEFIYELAWKTMKQILESEGVTQINSPRTVIKAAWQNGLIENEKGWLDMLDDRNIIAHSYDQSYAEALALRIPAHVALFNDLLVTIKKNKEKER